MLIVVADLDGVDTEMLAKIGYFDVVVAAPVVTKILVAVADLYVVVVTDMLVVGPTKKCPRSLRQKKICLNKFLFFIWLQVKTIF